MDKNISEETTEMENRSYIIGREGHIYINDPTVSKQHAEIQIISGEVYLRDLGSTNGTYLIKNQRLVPFKPPLSKRRKTTIPGLGLFEMRIPS